MSLAKSIASAIFQVTVHEKYFFSVMLRLRFLVKSSDTYN